MATRRRFLQALGISPVAAPLAAKVAADKAIADAVGVTAFPPPMSDLPGPGDAAGNWKQKVIRFLAKNTLPDWFDDELRARNRHVFYLDPDIANKKSWSMSVKIATQRERNIARARQDALESQRRGLRVREFEEQTGIWL